MRIVFILFALMGLSNLLNAQSYCIPAYLQNCTYTFIENISVANLNETATGCTTPLDDRTATTINMSQGLSYPFTVTSLQTGFGQANFLGWWIDFNNNGVFGDAGEFLGSYIMASGSTNANVWTGSITIPSDAPSGTFRLRVRGGWSSSHFTAGDACTSRNYGEAHDYTVVIGSAACNAPSLQASGTTFSNIAQTTASVNWTNGNGAGRVVYINTTNTFTAPANGTNPTTSTSYSGGQQCIFNGTGSGPVNVSGLTAGTQYYVRVYEYCSPDRTYNTQTATNNPNDFSTNPLSSPYVLSTTSCDFGSGSGAGNPAPFNTNSFSSSGNLTISSGVYDFTNFTLNAGHTLTITGSQPVVIRCTGTANIQGRILAVGTAGTSIDASATNTSAPLNAPGGVANNGGGQNGGTGADYNGLGGTAGGSYISTAGQQGGGRNAAAGCGTSNSLFGAGGGGSFGSTGGASVSVSCGSAAASSNIYGDAGFTTIFNNTNLLGGSGGGGGSYNVNSGTVKGGGGGSGGGAFAIVADNIIIGSSALLSVKGGNGGSGRLSGGSGTHYGCGGGAGSGGSILLLYNTATGIPTPNTNAASNPTSGIDISGGTGGASLLGNPGSNGGQGRFLASACSVAPPSCTAPSQQATNLTFTNIAQTTASVNWTNGNGAGRVVYINTTNTFIAPANGSSPTASTTYAGGQQCIFTGTGGGPVNVSGLTANTQYFVRVYEYCSPDLVYNTQPATNNPNDFTTLNSGGGGGTACTAPSQQATNLTFTNIAQSTASVNWTNGNGAGRVVYINTTNTFTAPANGSSPTASTTYAGGQQCIFTGTGGGPVNVSGLTANTQYFVRVYEYCSPDLVYNTQPATNNPNDFTTLNSGGGGGTPCTAPSQQATNLTFTNIAQSTASVNWTNGNGAGRVVYINTTNTFTAPANGSSPTASTTYAGGQQCIFTGTGGGPVNVSGLTANTQYFVRVYEYCSPDLVYNTQPATNNPNDFTTLNSGGGGGTACTAPLTQASQIVPGNITTGSVDVSWTNGSGNGRVVFINNVSAFTAPVNGTLPTASTVYTGGQQCIYVGNGNGPVNVTGLSSNTQYFLRVYEYCEPDYIFNTQTATSNPIGFNTGNASLTVFPNQIFNLNYTEGFGPSASQSYIISGSNLTGTGSITVQANNMLEVSSNNAVFSSSLSLPYTGGLITGQPVTLYVRLKAGFTVGQYVGQTVTHSGGGAAPVDLLCDGEVFTPTASFNQVKQNQLEIYPNPAEGESVTVSWQQAVTEEVIIRLYTPEGRLVYMQRNPVESGVASISIKPENLSSGIYLLSVQGHSSGFSVNSRLVWLNR
jgi:hypothetical protein